MNLFFFSTFKNGSPFLVVTLYGLAQVCAKPDRTYQLWPMSFVVCMPRIVSHLSEIKIAVRSTHDCS